MSGMDWRRSNFQKVMRDHGSEAVERGADRAAKWFKKNAKRIKARRRPGKGKMTAMSEVEATRPHNNRRGPEPRLRVAPKVRSEPGRD